MQIEFTCMHVQRGAKKSVLVVSEVSFCFLSSAKQKYGDLEVVWASDELQDSFLELPLQMVEVRPLPPCSGNTILYLQ